MVIIFDTCIVMDYLFQREPFTKDAKKILEISGQHRIDGVISAKTALDIHYLTKNHLHNEAKTREVMNALLKLVGIVSNDSSDVHEALSSQINDFEDAVLERTASRIGAEYIVTRNIKDFKSSKVPAILPEDFLKLLPEYCQ